MKRLFLATLLTVILGFASVAQADILFQQPADNYDAYYSNFTVGALLADDFSIPSGGTITGVKWTGGYTGTLPTDNFGIVIRSDVNGMPGAILASYTLGQGNSAGRTDTGTQFSASALSGKDIFTYQYALPTPFTAAAGTTYFVSIGNSYTSGWVWAESDGTSFVAFGVDGGQGGWISTALGNRAFELDGTTSSVPIPPAILLLGSGLIGLVGLRRKFKK